MPKKKAQALVTQLAANDIFGQFRFIKKDDGEICFAGKDVAKILGYRDTDKAIRDHVDAEDKETYPVKTTGLKNPTYPAKTAGQVRHMIFINESGLYSLIFNSQLPEAKNFKRWVTSEVLPSIRKTGSYSVSKRRIVETHCTVDIFNEFDNGEYEIITVKDAVEEYDDDGELIAIYNDDMKVLASGELIYSKVKKCCAGETSLQEI